LEELTGETAEKLNEEIGMSELCSFSREPPQQSLEPALRPGSQAAFLRRDDGVDTRKPAYGTEIR
jgi:hypothetical protein